MHKPYNAVPHAQTFGAAVFLLVQIVLLIDFCYDCAEWFREHSIKRNHIGEESIKPCWAFLMIVVMIGCLAVIATMAVLGFRWFTTPVASTHSTLDGKCGFNEWKTDCSTTLCNFEFQIMIGTLASWEQEHVNNFMPV